MKNPLPLESLQKLVNTEIAQSAVETDKTGKFPRSNLQALAALGVLGLTSSTEVGGSGGGLAEAATTVETVAAECPSTAMILCMHYAANAVLEKYASRSLREQVASGKHLSTLAFSEQGSRSHFWAPLGTAQKMEGDILLKGKKSWVTSAGEADSYVWSSQPLNGAQGSSIWFVSAKTKGLEVGPQFDGLGLRGNASSPIFTDGIHVTPDSLLGEDAQGFGIMMGDVLPTFSVLSASVSLGIMTGSIQRAIKHITTASFDHLGQKIIDLPTIRAYLAKAQIERDKTETLRNDTLLALSQGRPDAMLRVLEVKAAAGEAALLVCDHAMRICGGAAFRKEVGVERLFRDSRAASVMAPTSDVLYDFIGKAVAGLPLF